MITNNNNEGFGGMKTPHGETTSALKRPYNSDGWTHADTWAAWKRAEHDALMYHRANMHLRMVPRWVRWLWGAT